MNGEEKTEKSSINQKRGNEMYVFQVDVRCEVSSVCLCFVKEEKALVCKEEEEEEEEERTNQLAAVLFTRLRPSSVRVAIRK